MPAAILSLIGFVGTCILMVHDIKTAGKNGTPVAKSAIAWSAIFALFQLFLVVWGGLGLVACDEPLAIVAILIVNAALTGCAGATLERDRILAPVKAKIYGEGKFAHPMVATAICLMLAGFFAMLGLEISSNHDFTWVYPLCFLLEWAIITVVMTGLFFLCQRRGVLAALIAFVAFGFGVAEYFVITFKSMPIQPGDLTALSTAAAVAGTGYTYTLSLFCLFSLAFCALSMLLCQFAAQIAPKREAGDKRRILINLLVAVICLGGVTAHVMFIDYYHVLQIQIYTWRPLESYYRQGFIPSFISGAQTINPPKPEGYTVSGAKKTIKKYAKAYDEKESTDTDRQAAVQQFDSEKPTVIAIMNETFSDLSIYQNLHSGYEGPTYFKSLSDCLKRGKLYVSAYGGGTANTEFEFLTGNSMSNLGSGVYPYTTYDLTSTENLASQFKKLGYDTTAMHPNHGTNWNRENVYNDFGFDQFLTINDFADSDTLRGMVTDQATYDKILDLLSSNSNPQFIFDVTMQNHSGYDTGLIPEDKQVNLSIDGETDSEIDEYVSLIQQSDEALEYFLNALSKIDRKVVVVFWGDHQPFFPSKLNDKWFTDEDNTTHQERLWQTNYVIWANYDVAGNSQTSENDDLSTNYLGAELMQVIGAPLTNYQKAHICLRDALPAVNSTGFEDGEGRWYLSSADNSDGDKSAKASQKARDDYAKMQYEKMFGDGKDIYTKHYQSEANETDPNLAPGTTKIK